MSQLNKFQGQPFEQTASANALDFSAPLIKQLEFLSASPAKLPWGDEKIMRVLETLSEISGSPLRSNTYWTRTVKIDPKIGFFSEPADYALSISHQFILQKDTLKYWGEKVFKSADNKWEQSSHILKKLNAALLTDEFLDTVSGNTQVDFVSFLGHWINSSIWMKSRDILGNGAVVGNKPGHLPNPHPSVEQQIRAVIGWQIVQDMCKESAGAVEPRSHRWTEQGWRQYCKHIGPYMSEVWQEENSVNHGTNEVHDEIYPYIEAQSTISGAEVGSSAMMAASVMRKTGEQKIWVEEEGCRRWLADRIPLTKQMLWAGVVHKTPREWLVKKIMSDIPMAVSLGGFWDRNGAPSVSGAVQSIIDEQVLSRAVKIDKVSAQEDLCVHKKGPRV